MSLVLPDTIQSPQDLKQVMSDVQAYAKWASAYSIKKRVAATAATPPPPELSPATTALLQTFYGHDPVTQASLQKLLVSLRELETAAPRISITLAGAASGGFKKYLTSWCRTNLAANALLSVQFNATILGGMVIRYNSRIFDWSFRRQILSNRHLFPEVLRHV